jgi:hypothetical protein
MFWDFPVWYFGPIWQMENPLGRPICRGRNSLPVPSQNFEKLRHICPSVSPRGTTRLPLDRFSWNLIFECFFRKYVENYWIFIKIVWKYRVLYMKTNIHFGPYLPQFFLEWKIFETNIYKNSKHIFYVHLAFPFRTSCLFWDNVEKIW